MMQYPWQDRSLAALPYLIPLAGAIPTGVFLLREFPALVPIFFPLIWLHQILSIPIVPILGISLEVVLFFVLFGMVVQDGRISRFIRVNVMQSLLLSIVLFIASLVLRPLFSLGVSPLLPTVLANTTFLAVVGVSAYAIWESARGVVPEIPGISEAAQMQVR